MAVMSLIANALGKGSGLGVRSTLRRVLKGSPPPKQPAAAPATTIQVGDVKPKPVAQPIAEAAPAAPEPEPAEDTAGAPLLDVASALAASEEASYAEPEVVEEEEEEDKPPVGGFAAAARSAAASGVSSGVTFRLAAPGTSEGGAATNDVIIGESYDTELRIAEDGASYWGPVDNESARSKAAGEELDIDRDECIGCGTCVEHIDTVFFLNDDEGKAYVISQEGAMDRIDDAIDACPVTCISWQ
jgi:ferredoxin